MTYVRVSLKEKLNQRMLFQMLVLGLFGGPLVWLCCGPYTLGHFVWACIAMALAVPVLDVLRPCYRCQNERI